MHLLHFKMRKAANKLALLNRMDIRKKSSKKLSETSLQSKRKKITVKLR